MKRWIGIAVVLALALGGTACKTTRKPAARPAWTQARLDGALLTPADVPGFTRAADEQNEDDEQVCDAPDPTADAALESNVLLQRTEAGPYLGQTLASFEDADAAIAALDAFLRVVLECRSWQVDLGDGILVPMRIEPYALESLGDRSHAIRATSQREDVPLAGLAAVVRVEDVLMLLSLIGFEEELDEDTFERSVTTGIGRLRL